jgi:formate-dependent nitrite reductase membrane component NrfD
MEPVLFEVNAIAAGIPVVIIVIAFETIIDKHLENHDKDTVYRMTAYSVMLALGLYTLFFLFGKVLSTTTRL